jgi:diguanylate cyclase (GGDEF)-like protein
MNGQGRLVAKALALFGAAVLAYFGVLMFLSLSSLDGVADWSKASLVGLIAAGPPLAAMNGFLIWRWSRLLARDLAYHDDLTALANRRAFIADSSRLLRNAQPGAVALVLLDVDGLKGLNDRCGHQSGDELLRYAAQQMQRACLRGTVAYRIGGDEFAMLLVRAKGARLASLVRRLLPFTTSFDACGHWHEVKMSLGYASCEAGEDFDSLFRRADQRLRDAKSRLYGRSELRLVGARSPNAEPLPVSSPVLELVPTARR